MEKVYRKYAPKASPKLLFDFGKQAKKPLHARNYFENKIF